MKKSNQILDLIKNIKDDQFMETVQILRNAQNAKELAFRLFPNEQWIGIDQHIFMASSRAPRSDRQSEIIEQELAQARILANMGHTVYLLPEFGPRKTKHPDAIVDGLIMEFKTISGNERKIKEKYKEAREKAENVFLQIDPPFPHRTVAGKLSGSIRGKGYKSGLIWVYFKHTGKMVYWTVEGLK
ncbi:CdiA C-terminal domain-containing protein [Treponema sp. R6D11]